MKKKISAEQNVKRKTKIYMLFAGWEGRIVKNCDRGLEMLPEAAGLGQHFQVRGHSFSLYGPTLSRQITFFSLR